MSATTHYSNWTEYYDALPASTTINQGRMEQMLQSFDSSISPAGVQASMLQNKDIVFLPRTGFNKSLGLLHHLEILGGTIASPVEQCACILGIDRATEIVVSPDASILFKNPHVDHYILPARADIMKCTSVEEIDQLQVSNQHIRPRNFIPVPPFLIRTVANSIDSVNQNSKAVLLNTIKAIKEFDELYKDDDFFTEKAAIKCKLFIQWLFVAATDDNDEGIAQINFVPCLSVDLLQQISNFKSSTLTTNQDLNSQVTQALVAPLQQLAASSRSTQEALLRMTETQAKELSTSEKSFKKIPSKYRNMLLMAGSLGQVTPSTLNEEAMEFFKLSGVKQAHIHLNTILEGKHIRVSVPHAVANALYNGAFKWTNLAVPSGFASTVMETESFLRNDVLREAMVLEASTKFSISDEYVEKLRKTSIEFPTTSEDTIERFKAMRELSILFFQTESLLAQFYINLVNWCLTNRRTLDLSISTYVKFIAKFLMATDNRVNLFFEHCMNAESPRELPIRLLRADSICDSIEVNEFYYNLPKTVKLVAPSSAGDKRNADGYKKDQNPQRVTNTNMVQDWKLRDNEDYSVFRHKVKEGPLLSFGCHGCHRFHNQGVCFSDCENVASHCKLTGNDFELFNKRVKAIRGE